MRLPAGAAYLRAAARLLVVGLAACLPDATRPRGGVPTLDDAGADGFVAVSAGRRHSCGLTADGAAWCWGSNEFGQLGVPDDGTRCIQAERGIPCRTAPVAVSGGLAFRRISAGGVHTCALGVDDRIYCWGDNLRGSLGDPAVRRSAVPIPIASTAIFFDVAAGGEHSCGLRTDGVAVCWGANDMGQVGTGSGAAGFAAPATLSGALRFASIAASGERSCARTADGAAYCWGASWVNRVGGVDVTRPQSTPARVQTTLAFEALRAGAHTTCGVSSDNRAHCWEANATGAIGDGTLIGSLTPRAVTGGLIFSDISSGGVHSCGIADSGLAYCWGAGALGELGVASALLRSRCGQDRTPCSAMPVQVSGWRRFSRVSVGEGSHACALTASGNIYCWGAGELGQRGDGRTSAGEWSPTKTRPPQNAPVL